jgi:hypothetical protein
MRAEKESCDVSGMDCFFVVEGIRKGNEEEESQHEVEVFPTGIILLF